MKGRTTRLILEALTALTHGRHVVVVARPAEEAFRIQEEIKHYADVMCIPCGVSDGNWIDFMSDVPLIYIRPFDWTPMTVRRCDPQPVVLIDHTTVHERTVQLACTSRTVQPLEGGVFGIERSTVIVNGSRCGFDVRTTGIES